jgi:hypothetical protein
MRDLLRVGAARVAAVHVGRDKGGLAAGRKRKTKGNHDDLVLPRTK